MKSRHTRDLTTGPVVKNLLAFVYPLLVANLLQHLYQATDNAVVGKCVSKQALGSVSATGSATTMVLNIIVGLAVGASIVNANLLGAKKTKELRRSMHNCILIALVGGVLMSVIGILVTRPMLRVMRCPEGLMDGAVLYMRIIFLGTPGTMLYNFGSGILRTHGDSKRPMLIMACSGLVNVVLNLLFVLCFGMTVDGVALATIISKYISAAWVLLILFNPKGDFKLSLREMKFHGQSCANIIKVGLPCGINGLVFSISNVIVQSSVNKLGADVVAASGAANNLTAFIYQILIAFYSACVSFTGQCCGASNYKRIWKLLGASLGICSGVIILISSAYTIWPSAFLRIFNDDPQVIKDGTVKLLIMAWSYVLYAISEIFLGCIRGLKKTTFSTAVNIFSICGVRLLWIWCVCPLDPGNAGLLYCCYPISYVFSCAALMWYFFVCMRKLEKNKLLAATQ